MKWKFILFIALILPVTFDGLKNEEYALMHGGGGQGVACNVILLPGSKQGLVVLTNGDRGSEICNKILMKYLDCGEEILSRVR